MHIDTIIKLSDDYKTAQKRSDEIWTLYQNVYGCPEPSIDIDFDGLHLRMSRDHFSEFLNKLATEIDAQCDAIRMQLEESK